LVDRDVVMEPAEQPAISDTGFAAVGLRGRVVDLAGRGGLVAPVGEPAVLVPGDHRIADRGRDVPADPDIQRQARPAQPPAELLAPQERGQPAGAGQQSDSFPGDGLLKPKFLQADWSTRLSRWQSP
jgi:hypothetical protein